MIIKFNLNGRDVSYELPSNLRVVDLLREHLNLTGTKEACGSGECGACTILVNGESRLACLILVSQLQGKEVVTIEAVGSKDKLHPIQEEFIKKGAIQCGFCTPGMVASTIDLLKRNKRPTREEIREGISGNICRCTGYQKIVDAIEAVSKRTVALDNFIDKNNPSYSLMNKDKLIETSKVFLPTTLEELWSILDKNPNSIIYAGGTDVLTKRKKGIIPDNKNLICMENIEEIKNIEENDNEVIIGAGVTHNCLLENKIISKNFPVLIQAVKVIGSPQIRHMGTIGGNICTASPAGDTLPPLYVLNAIIEVRSRDTIKEIPIKDFIISNGKTILKKDEIISRIKIKKTPDYNVHYYEKVGQRNALSISIAGIAIIAKISDDKTIEDIKIAWGSVSPTIVISKDVDNELKGKKLSKESIESVFPLIEKSVNPISDIRASKDYRVILAKNLLLRLEEICQ